MELLVIDGEAKVWEEALALTFEALYQKGYVKASFLAGCIEREKKYPTGLVTEVPVAVPHTDACHVVKAALCLLRLKHPVNFYDMGNPGETVPVEYVFNMAFPSGEAQVKRLKAIIAIAQDSKFLGQAKAERSEKLYDFLRHKLE